MLKLSYCLIVDKKGDSMEGTVIEKGLVFWGVQNESLAYFYRMTTVCFTC